jgi:hypothetical protein
MKHSRKAGNGRNRAHCKRVSKFEEDHTSPRIQPRIFVEPTFLVSPLHHPITRNQEKPRAMGTPFRGSNGLLTPTHRSRGGLSNFAPPALVHCHRRDVINS